MTLRIKRGAKYGGYVLVPISRTTTTVTGKIKLSRFVFSEPITYRKDQLIERT